MKKKKPIWKANPEKHDYPAAIDYLSLLFDNITVKKMITELKETKTIYKKAKDLRRACGNIPILKANDPHVRENLKKIEKGELLSPCLFIRHNNILICADGFHRLSTIYYTNYDLDIPCRII